MTHQPATASVQEYVDDRVLAERTTISRARWQQLRWSQEGPPYYKIGRRVLYRWSEVNAWIEAQVRR